MVGIGIGLTGRQLGWIINSFFGNYLFNILPFGIWYNVGCNNR